MRRFFVVLFMLCVLVVLSCTPEAEHNENEGLEKYGILEFYNPAAGRNISQYGETITLSMKTTAPYRVELAPPTGEWAVLERGETGMGGFNQLRLRFLGNEGEVSRTVEMSILVEGYEKVTVAVFNQSRIMSEEERNETLNRYMHNRLLEEYLWAEAYSELDVDFTVDYRDFLQTHLLKLGNINIEDGGFTGQHTSEPGTRFIYSNIQAVTPATKSGISNYGLGFGPFFASSLTADNSIYCLAVSYVHPGSPAAKAGICRGDVIFKINGEYVTSETYNSMSDELFSNPSGTYSLVMYRDGQIKEGDELSVSVTPEAYDYNPVIFTKMLQVGDKRVGYLVLESFEYDCQTHLERAIGEFKSGGMTDMVLDLRFNMGGSVAQSRWLTGCIAGAAYRDRVFASLVYNDSSKEVWRFRGGPDELDDLGMGPDLGLDRVFVIGSYYTASASEMVINSLRGVDFDVCHIGGRTEGKNVGMTTTVKDMDGVKYIFSPITFRIENERKFSDYPTGLVPDIVLSDQDLDFADGDRDLIFPFSFSNWDVEGANVALDLVISMLGTSNSIQSVGTRSLSSVDKSFKLPFTPVAPCRHPLPLHGRYGSIIIK